MDKEFWIERWNNDEIPFHKTDVNPALLKHFKKNAPASPCVFVPLSGKSIDLLWLARKAVMVRAVELSQLAVDAFFEENQLKFEKVSDDYIHKNLVIRNANFFELEPDFIGDCNFVYDRGSLVALPPKMRQDYRDKLKVLLPNPHRHLLVTVEHSGGKDFGPPFSVEEQEVRELFSSCSNIQCLETNTHQGTPPHLQEKGVIESTRKTWLIET